MSESLRSARFEPPSAELRAECDRRARESEAEERERMSAQRLHAAGIPQEFEGADLSQCDQRVAEWVGRIRAGSSRNLILQGAPGVGKSHAAAAALLALLGDRSGRFAREVSIVSDIRDMMGGRDSESSIVSRYSGPAVLVIDDLGKVQHRDWSLPILWEIVDNRHVRRKPTIFTMQGDSRVLTARLSTETDQGYTAAAILDRMRDSDVVALDGGSRRGGRA